VGMRTNEYTKLSVAKRMRMINYIYTYYSQAVGWVLGCSVAY